MIMNITVSRPWLFNVWDALKYPDHNQDYQEIQKMTLIMFYYFDIILLQITM